MVVLYHRTDDEQPDCVLVFVFTNTFLWYWQWNEHLWCSKNNSKMHHFDKQINITSTSLFWCKEQSLNNTQSKTLIDCLVSRQYATQKIELDLSGPWWETDLKVLKNPLLICHCNVHQSVLLKSSQVVCYLKWLIQSLIPKWKD